MKTDDKLVSRPVEDYRQFIVNRAVKLLPLFLIALIFGQFLWFIPSILAVIFAAAFTMRLISDEIMKRLERVQNIKT